MQLTERFFHVRRVVPIECDPRARFGKRLRNRKADSGRAASDQRDFSIQPETVPVHLSTPVQRSAFGASTSMSSNSLFSPAIAQMNA